MAGNTKYLDAIGFTDLVKDKLKPEQLVELSDTIEKADKLIDQIFVAKKKSSAYAEAIDRWMGEGVGGDGIYNYADMFGSYRDLYNLLEKAKIRDTKYRLGQNLLLYIRRIYEILPLPSMKETFEDREALKREMHKSLRKSQE